MLKDRIRGAWLGLAAGDRIGGPLRMALCLGESLLEKAAFDSSDILEKYRAWWKNEGFDTGLVAYEVFKRIEEGIAPQEAVLQVHQQLEGLTGGCNPMHRAMPLALCPFLDESQLLQATKEEALLSHYKPIAGECAQAVVLLLRHIIHDKSLDEAIAACESQLPQEVFERLHHQVSPELSRGGYAPDVLETAMFFLREKRDFRNSLASSLGFAGMENYSPVVVGMLAGALYGAKAIPENALHHCKIVPQVEAMADRFIKLWE